MDILIYVGITIFILLAINIFSIIKVCFFPETQILKDKPVKCASQVCAFYKVHDNEGKVTEKASCFYGVKKFEDKYRGKLPCSKAIPFFGEDPLNSYNLVYQRRQHVENLINRFASYLSLILVIYKLIQGNQ